MEGFEKLTNSLLAAKQVMNKVETGTYQSGNVDPSLLQQSPTTPTTPTSPQPTMTQRAQSPVGANLNEDKIRNSNLPENIKQLMIENPIPTVDYANELPSGFIDEVAKKMEEQSQFGAGAQKTKSPQQIQRPQSVPQQTINEDSLKDLIRETIKESVQEIVSEELQKLTEGTLSLKENLQIRVGNSVFVGKITDVRKGK